MIVGQSNHSMVIDRGTRESPEERRHQLLDPTRRLVQIDVRVQAVSREKKVFCGVTRFMPEAKTEPINRVIVSSVRGRKIDLRNAHVVHKPFEIDRSGSGASHVAIADEII
jgi:hypothetical protein